MNRPEAGADSGWIELSLPLPAAGEMPPFSAAGLDLLLCRFEDAFYVLENKCSHGQAELAAGTLRGCILECPLHGGKLDVRSGEPLEPPIRRPVATYAVRVDGESVAVCVGVGKYGDGEIGT